MSLRDKLIADIESYAATTGYAPSYVCRLVMGSGSWWRRLTSPDFNLAAATVDKFEAFFSDKPAVKGLNPRATPKRRKKKKPAKKSLARPKGQS